MPRLHCLYWGEITDDTGAPVGFMVGITVTETTTTTVMTALWFRMHTAIASPEVTLNVP